MKKLFFLVTLLFFSHLSFAQFGITGGFAQLNSEEWQEDIKATGTYTLSEDFLTNGQALGIDYWFRLKNYRIEFLPELRVSRYTGTLTATDQEVDLKVNNIGLNFNTNIYPFDLEGDCDCPTWSKEGPTLKKGLFIRISPSIGYWNINDDITGGEQSSGKSYDIHASLGAGLGFDIGLSDLLTITPLVEYRWHGAEQILTYASNEYRFNDWFAGIRLGVRLDD